MDDTRAATHHRPRVAVFAPAPVLVCTFEHPHDRSNPDVTLNVGGQGPWVAKAADALGADVVLVAPLGGDTGVAARHLLLDGPYDVRPVATQAATACYVEEREGGERTCLRDAAPGRLLRHELDDLYSATLAVVLDADVCVITGSPWGETLDTSLLTRLTGDLGALGRTTVADLSGPQLAAALEGGLDWLKVAHDELDRDLAARPPGRASRAVRDPVVATRPRSGTRRSASRVRVVAGAASWCRARAMRRHWWSAWTAATSSARRPSRPWVRAARATR